MHTQRQVFRFRPQATYSGRTFITSFAFLLIIILMTSGCGGNKLKLHDWRKLPDEQYTIPPYAKQLARYKIALDPGHGGNERIPGYKRGPTGKREAVMNLSVANLLKEFLDEVGVEVFLTRTDESFVSLQDRVKLAEEAGCDFMISLHHNAGQNPQANYSAVFYHLTPDYSPFSMDLARNIYFGLVEALRLPQVVADGLLSDKVIYPAGFGLLRQSKIPALILESSFYSNEEEEKRLMNRSYNRREAYGIFLGLARWAAGGVPMASMLSPESPTPDKQPEITYRISDGISDRINRNLEQQLIFSESVTASIDGKRVRTQISDDFRTISFSSDSTLANGPHLVRVNLLNMYKNHNLPHTDTLIVSAPTDSIHFETPTQYLSADPNVQMPVRISLFDADGAPIWDSTKVEIATTRGSLSPQDPLLRNAQTTTYFRGDDQIGLVYLTANVGTFTDTLLFSLIPPGQSWVVSGTVKDDSTDLGIPTAEVALSDSIKTVTDENGFFYFLDPPIGFTTLTVTRKGYEPRSAEVTIDSTISAIVDFRTQAFFNGLLHGEVIILDAALGEAEPGDVFDNGITGAEANLNLALALATALENAGATPILVRPDSVWISTQDRIKQVNAMPEGWYLKIVYERAETDSTMIQTTIYPANKTGEDIAGSILTAFTSLPYSKGKLVQDTSVPEVTYTNKTAIELKIRCRQPETRQRDLRHLLTAIINFKRQQAIEQAAADANSSNLSESR